MRVLSKWAAPVPGSAVPLPASAGRIERAPSLFQLGRRVHPERHGLDPSDLDAHAGLQRPQLLQPLAQLERRRRQRHEAVERGPAVGVQADVVEHLALAPRHRQLAEIQGAAEARSEENTSELQSLMRTSY